jgi:hypothetical protein
MHMDDALRSTLLMQRIDILRAQEEPVRQAALQFRQREVGWVRLDRFVPLSPFRIELPHQSRIGGKRLGCRDIFDPVATPNTVYPTKSGQAALGANSRAGQHEQVILAGQSLHFRQLETLPARLQNRGLFDILNSLSANRFRFRSARASDRPAGNL